MELTRILIDFIRETIETELPAELRYLTMHDEIRSRMRDIVELPDRHADLFVKLARQNDGRLSKRKRELAEFAPLTDGEIDALERVIREGLGFVTQANPVSDSPGNQALNSDSPLR